MVRRKQLNFKKEYKEKIASGQKTSTIRLKTNLRKGDEVEILSGGFKVGIARIVSVESKLVCELTDEDARRDGFRDKRELMKALKRYYGELKGEDRVHVIGFEIVCKNSES
ncbi:MAG: hypothetical protein DRJ31_05380 [Candidatus Methanomethylicota archaeon]|uniref:ASCH domain-containing protein n=1 Tax=Thermoproteota archaeon TaxID=2056631 RepID=A0A497EQB6_9CREN|nr:MAG: hypothetical protein DRJ31_05380 [Candidatus Verstraetearchaeota archaeon]RLE52998.1 MAG: hypothetical protein DRJ33_02250 [Candidatus Verstraetearchaeota archaeon]